MFKKFLFHKIMFDNILQCNEVLIKHKLNVRKMLTNDYVQTIKLLSAQ